MFKSEEEKQTFLKKRRNQQNITDEKYINKKPHSILNEAEL